MAEGHGRTAVEVGAGILVGAGAILAAIGGAVYTQHQDSGVMLWVIAGCLLLVAVVVFFGYFVMHPLALFLDRKRVEWIADQKLKREWAREKARVGVKGGGVPAVGVGPAPLVQIVAARYGRDQDQADVAEVLRKHIGTDGRVKLQVTNGTMEGDPAEGHIKTLVVHYKVGGGPILETRVTEEDHLDLP